MSAASLTASQVRYVNKSFWRNPTRAAFTFAFPLLAVSAVQVNRDISLEEVQAALSEALGPAYRVKAMSGSALRVTRNPVIWGTVHVSWSGGTTSFRVRPGGLIVLAALNALYTTPKIRHGLSQAFPPAA